jgi:hypothetical protein
MDYNLDFEETGNGSMTLDYEHFKCEAPDCNNDATVEWVAHYELDEGGTVYTYRCDSHPVRDPDYQVVDL